MQPLLTTYTMWGPPVISWFINPMKTIVISTINHSYWSYLHQLSYLGGPTLYPSIKHGVSSRFLSTSALSSTSDSLVTPPPPMTKSAMSSCQGNNLRILKGGVLTCSNWSIFNWRYQLIFIYHNIHHWYFFWGGGVCQDFRNKTWKCSIVHGSLNVSIEHHPTIRFH